jgi:hypothetical protein
MNAATLIARAAAEGVTLDLTAAGTLKASGANATVDRWLPVIRQHKEAILAARKVRRRVPDLAEELIAFWEDDVADILQLPDEALRRLAEDYRRHREYYCAAMRRRH